ncbi:MAG: putative porin [Bacteroidales bacterium]|nr:putative porin [Bacteroidales bacterium]
MKSLSSILLPVAVTTALAASVMQAQTGPQVRTGKAAAIVNDSVIYPSNAYKLNRIGDFEEIEIADSLKDNDFSIESFEDDTLPRLTARDTIQVPDSLRDTDPFRYEYYVALLDSATHRFVCDSLLESHDTLLARGDTIPANEILQLIARIDSTYSADSAARAQLAFEIWYNSLSKDERKAYDYEQMVQRKMAESDSLRQAKEDKKALKDSIMEATPRILSTFYFPEGMQYKRIVAWEVDQDFHMINPYEIDTTANYHYYDYPIFREDVNASWLGVGGSPVQSYNFFNRESREDVEFYKTSEPWSFSPGTLSQYNTKTPHTELGYSGTLFAGDQKESDNLHIFTTQNINPNLNFSILYNLYGGAGILENEKTSNKTLAATIDYVGKRYLMNAGVVNNKINRGENGGITDRYFVRDTAGIDSREIPVTLKNASSTTKKTTFFLDQQYRIPFEFIKKAKDRKEPSDSIQAETPDSEPVPVADTIDRNVTSIFIGHSSEFSKYFRTYKDNIGTDVARAFYNNVFNFDPANSADSMAVTKLDNKVFLKLQPWSQNAIVSSLNVGIGDLMRTYFDSTSLRPTLYKENSVYAYAGAEGHFRRTVSWNAKGHLYTIGANAGDFDLEGNIDARFYPFRKFRNSPLSFDAGFKTSLKEPNHYQQALYTNHFLWENNFGKISTTKVQGGVHIPRWGFDATVGYALLANNIYYDNLGMICQNPDAMSVLSAYIHKDIVIACHIHLDNRVLFQKSSNEEVLPLPELALNLRYYVEFDINKGAMTMQIGGNGFYNTQWYAPAFNPVLGVFHNQTSRLYENGPFIDVFLNLQWKRACIFVKYQNLLKGWPMEKKDYFSADSYIVTQDGMEGLKIGIFWPFYNQDAKAGSSDNHKR